MLKRTTVFALLLTLLLVLGGCTSKLKSAPAPEIADKVLEGIAFEDELMEVDGRVVEEYYGIELSNVKEYAVYMSASGATAEEIAIFQASSEDAAKKIEEALASRVNDLKIGFENYVPAEMTKLGNAVIIRNGSTAMLVIANDHEAARGIVKDYK